MVSAADLPPGGEGKIEVRLATAGHQGWMEKAVEVYSNDPVTPRLVLKVSGNVVAVAAGATPSPAARPPM